MAMYLIGDVQGCDEPLSRLLQKIDFSPSRDTLYVLGDLVNRGPESAAVLRRMMGFGASARCLLGNHDLHLLAVAAGIRPEKKGDTLGDVLQAPDREALLDWVRSRPVALRAGGWLMVHAGVLPSWTADETLSLGAELSAVLSGPAHADFLREMYGNTPDAWDPRLRGADRLRVIVNALTRLRFCTPDGVMEFGAKEGAGAAPPGHLPWFDVPGRRTAGTPVAFGHWSTLGFLRRDDLVSMDTGCVWGGCLSALELGAPAGRALAQVACPQAARPG